MNEPSSTFTLTIRRRPYRVDAGPRQLVVIGQLENKAGRLLPGLLDELQSELRARGYPVMTEGLDMLVKDGTTLLLTYNKPQAYQAANRIFAAHVAGTEEAQRLLTEASTVDRRYHLAMHTGIHLNSGTWLAEPIRLLTKEWESLCRRLWTDNDFDYRFKHLIDDVPIVTFNYTQYRYRRDVKPAGPEDLAWLRARLAEVAAAVASLTA